jgi:hypothetical protein
MKDQILRIAQEAPGAPPPPDMPAGDLGGGAPPPGMPPMDMMGGMGAPPPGGGAPEPVGPKPPILQPLDNLGAILSDYNVDNALKTMLSNSPRDGSTGEEEIGMLVWRTYGGDTTGGVVPGRLGKRSYDNPLEEPETLNIIKDPGLKPVQNRWIRLPQGMSLKDLEITLENVQMATSAYSISNSISSAQKAKAGTTSMTIDKMIKIAKKLDELGLYEISDQMFHF